MRFAANADYDLQSMFQELTSIPYQARRSRDNKPKSIWKLKKRTYDTQLSSIESHQTADKPAEMLTPPDSPFFSGPRGKRRKTMASTGMRTDNEEQRYQLVLQMQLLKTTEDEEALIWTSSDDEQSGTEL